MDFRYPVQVFSGLGWGFLFNMFFTRNNFIVIQGFAVTDLKLSGNELICYSIVYGFTQDGETKFNGGLAYIAEAMNVSKNTAKSVLDRLITKGLIVKTDRVINRIKFCEYEAVVINVENLHTVQETCTPIQETCTGGVQETCTNNIYYNINSKDNSKIADQKDLFGNAHGADKKTLFRNSDIYGLADIEANDYSQLESLFSGEEYADIDIVYYFHAVADWSDSSNTKRTKRGWLSTIRNFIRGDIERGKLHTKTQQIKNNNGFDFAAAAEYLNM